MAISHFFGLVSLLVMVSFCPRCSSSEVGESYNSKFRPNDGGPPVDVHVGVYVESLGGIKETTMDFQLTMYFRESWQDPRLSFNGTGEKIFVGATGNTFWSPDIFFLFEKSGREHDITQPNTAVKIQPNGSVYRSSRISVTTACYMDLHRFPFDSQRCSLNAMSYSYSTKDMTLHIGDEDVEVETELMMPSFILESIQTENRMMQYSTAGNFSLAKIIFTFQRQMQSFILTVYIPSILLVTLAWLSFCIDAQAAPARVSLGITTVLTITTMTAGIQESLPVVTYAKAIDIWLAACLVFVFLALLEYALANYLLILNKKRKEARQALEELESASKQQGEKPPSKEGLAEDRLSGYKTQYFSSVPSHKAPSNNSGPKDVQLVLVRDDMLWTADRVDRLARYAYPTFFIIFNIVYWPVFILMKPAYE